MFSCVSPMQEAEIAELEEQIAEKLRERTAQDEVLAGIKAELEEINKRVSQTDKKVDRVTARSEELSVSHCDLLCTLYMSLTLALTVKC